MNKKLLLAVLALLPGVSLGAEVFDQFFRFAEVKNKSIEPHLPGEVVDHFTGTLSIVQEDLSLPGKGGLDLRIVRSYSSKIWTRSDALDLEPLIADKEPTPVGFGWKMHLGRVRNPFATGTALACGGSDVPIYEAADGSARVFYPTGTANQFVSRDLWRLVTNCTTASGSGICITTTTGEKLEFADSRRFYVGGLLAAPGACPNGDALNCMLPMTRTLDVFGNQITATYVPNTGLPSVVTDTWSRQVEFAYSACGARQCLDSITARGVNGASRQVTYDYMMVTTAQTGGAGRIDLPSPGRAFLTGVHALPAATAPGYSYAYGFSNTVANNQYALTGITYPYGGTTTYGYGTKQFFTGNDTIPLAVVTSRTTAGPSLPTGLTTYDYLAPATGTDSGFVRTTVTRPGNVVDVYRHFGFGGATASGTIFKVGLLESVNRGNGSETETREWAAGQVVSQADFPAPMYGTACPNQLFDNTVNAPILTKVTVNRDGSRYETVFSNHDAQGQPQTIVETGEAQRTTGTKPTRTTTLTYNTVPSTNQIVGRMATEHVCVGSDCADSSRIYYPGTKGNSLNVETIHGVATTFDYTAEGNLYRVTNALGQTLELGGYSVGYGIATTLDFNGAFSHTREAYWDGSLKSETDGRNNKTSYTYDSAGRLQTVSPPGAPTTNEVTTYEYSSTGDWYSNRRGGDVTGFRERFDLDGLGRIVTTRRGASSTSGGFASVDRRVVRTYDALGRVSFESYPLDASSAPIGQKYDYDTLGRVTTVSQRFPQGGTCQLSAQCTTVTTAQGSNHCRTTTIQRGSSDSVATTNCFESFGDPSAERLVKVTDAKTKTWTYTYDVLGNLMNFAAPLAQGSRSATFTPVTFFPKTTTSGPRGMTTVNSHNVMGQPLLETDARGVATSFDYTDPLSRLKVTTYGAGGGTGGGAGGGGGSSEVVTRTYDKELVQSVGSTNGGTYTYTHDALGRVTSQTWVVGGQSFVTSWLYDAAGCLYQTTYPTGTVLTATCDKGNRHTSLSIGSSSIASAVTYSPEGRASSMTYGNGKVVTTTMEKGRVKSIASPGVMGLSYTYDGASNVKSITDSVTPALTASSVIYDSLDRLDTVSTAAGNFSYSYDEVGNRKSKTVPGGATTTFTYSPVTNRLTSSSGPGGLTPVSSLTWNNAAMLQTSSDGATYRYDGFGRRIAKVAAAQGIDVLYHYDPSGNLLAETLPSGVKIREYLYVGGQLVAINGCISGFSVACSDREWYHTDLVGSVVARTSTSGAASRMNYHPWGESGSAVSGTRLFNGRTFDLGTGFYDYGARIYSPELARFLSPDLAWAAPSNPQSSNPYAYVLNNPYKYSDPSGNVPFFVVTGIGGAVGGAIAGAALMAYMTYDPQTGVNWGAVGVGALSGGLIGGAIGVGVGDKVALAVAGSEGASFGAVAGKLLPWIVGGGAATEQVIERNPNIVQQVTRAPSAPMLADKLQSAGYVASQGARATRPEKILEYAQQMRAGQWDWSGPNKIVLDANNMVMDGHHRVAAAVLSNTTIPESAIYRMATEAVGRVAVPWSQTIPNMSSNF